MKFYTEIEKGKESFNFCGTTKGLNSFLSYNKAGDITLTNSNYISKL
jgi:hypothetical protein